jgi:hypothetical protein
VIRSETIGQRRPTASASNSSTATPAALASSAIVFELGLLVRGEPEVEVARGLNGAILAAVPKSSQIACALSARGYSVG